MTRRRLAYGIPAAVVAVILAVLLVHMRGIPGQTRPHRDVGTHAQAVRDAFNAAAGTVRIVALVSPTCGACLRGAADLQTQVFDTIASPKVHALTRPLLHRQGLAANSGRTTACLLRGGTIR